MSECKQETMGEAVARYVAMSDEDRIVFDRIRDPEQQVVVGKDDNFSHTLMLSGLILKTIGCEVDEWLITHHAVRMLDHAAICKDPNARYLALFAPTRAALREMVEAGDTFVKYTPGNEALAKAGFLLKLTRNCAVTYELTDLGRTVVAAHRGQ